MKKNVTTQKPLDSRYITITGMLSAIAFILMYVDFSVPFMPSFIQMDLSELPALIGGFAFGPFCGILICLIKNVLHMAISSTGLVGELANFLLGAIFVGTAAFIYKQKKTKKMAIIASVVGAFAMGIISIPVNYYITYPFYYNFMSKEAVLAAYQAILPTVDSIMECLILFNFPFTTIKGLISVIITLGTYKHLSTLLKGKK